MDTSSLGNRMKSYEKNYSQNAVRGLPIIVRLDGKSFSKFTKRFERPFCSVMKSIMTTVAASVAKESDALLAYTQSDEITLILHTDNVKGMLYFDGNINKLNSTLASRASSVFTKALCKVAPDYLNEDVHVSFDCRSFVVPSKEEAVNALLWRYKDCLKNSVSQVASCYFKHKELFGKSRSDRIGMLEGIGVFWHKYPEIFKEGSFLLKNDGYNVHEFTTRFDEMDFNEKVLFVFGKD